MLIYQLVYCQDTFGMQPRHPNVDVVDVLTLWIEDYETAFLCFLEEKLAAQLYCPLLDQVTMVCDLTSDQFLGEQYKLLQIQKLQF